MTPRQLIREAAKAALLNNTRAGARVYSGRPNPLSQQPSALGGLDELPAIIIYTRATKSKVFDESPRRYRHEADLTVECSLEIGAGQEIDDELEEFEQEVHNALLLDDSLGDTADDLMLTGSTNTINGDGDRLLAAVIITFEAIFYTEAPVPGTQTLDDLERVHVEFSLDGNQDDPDDRAKTDIEGLEQ